MDASRARGELARALGFGLVTLALAVTQPFVLIALPLALLLVGIGPRNPWTAALVGVLLALSFLGDRSGVWWFERGWPLLLAGMYLWMAAWRPGWSFSTRALAALGLAAAATVAICAVNPAVWLELDATMGMRAAQATEAATKLLGERADERIGSLMQKVAGLQVAVFPALLGVSSLSALGAAVSVRSWLAGEAGRAFGQLRRFRFNDHLIWFWLVGLVLVLAPAGELARRVGGNAVFFMGALYAVRGLAVVLSLIGGISIFAGVIGGLVALLVSPILAAGLGVMLVIGLGDTWLNLRSRASGEGKAD
ncbi:MAG: DUF2232 domain-containing protein [Gemmatimonadetes bacterium]|uniref:DUF2232 domain-containing protein n=1 Tax=Candidatus Kutchimonas denitrificans TaxID=3056748 RepID=A0AAE4Z998_9BACT|nr:DUF2232 domain-containing protein [Gemmatimonadota bacterium]NIR74997.1 DUF2232 domain-containing protein [Candidatus Kutchimonas denitrificans]NIS01580.1 DUF2232 domain-containing protein [Gemmatimonadota bacterium]NIT67318.1 DUF2232 domain-containing protein [Gemmatimonadota bacterium]NIU52681.1 DUF2232 domain-containing protein [Gemmatimonadota bacterium]